MQDLVAEKRADRDKTDECDGKGWFGASWDWYLDINGRQAPLRNLENAAAEEFHEILILPLRILLRPMRNAIVLWQLFTMPFDRFRPV